MPLIIAADNLQPWQEQARTMVGLSNCGAGCATLTPDG
jgi:hypothetical protein